MQSGIPVQGSVANAVPMPLIASRAMSTKLIDSQGVDVNEISMGDNFNVYAGYEIAGRSDSGTWKPSDAWQKGRSSGWYDASK